MIYRSSQGSKPTPIWGLIGLNFILFIVTLVNRDVVSLLGFRPLSFSSQPWTIVTNMFIHSIANPLHILANMFTLYFLGGNLFRLIGGTKFLVVYFLGGILGNILFMLLESPFTMVVGASGAIFALGGALAVMRPRLKVLIFPIPVPLPLWAAIIGIFVFLTFVPSNIAWQAHLGGLIVGVIAGYFFRKRERRLYFAWP